MSIMPDFVSTVTTKGQTTVPVPVRKALALAPGRQLVWRLEPAGQGGAGGAARLVVEPAPELDELAGCLAGEVPFLGIEAERRAAQQARARHAHGRERRVSRGGSPAKE